MLFIVYVDVKLEANISWYILPGYSYSLCSIKTRFLEKIFQITVEKVLYYNIKFYNLKSSEFYFGILISDSVCS
jgi:hypothetical protein